MRILFFLLFQFLFSGHVLANAEVMSASKEPCKSFSNSAGTNGKIVIHDDIMRGVLEGIFAWENIEQLYGGSNAEISRTAVSNIHWPNITDYIVIVKKNEDFLSYYLAQKKSIPLCIVISWNESETPLLKLLGKPLSLFQKEFDFDENIDVLTVTPLENTFFIKFFFSHKKVISVVYKDTYLP